MATYSFTLADSAPVSISRGFVDPGDTVTKSVGGSSGTVTYDPDTSFLAGPRLNVSSTAGLPRDANAGAGLSEIVTIFLRSSTAPDVAPALTGLPVTVRVSATLKADATAGQAGLALGSANATARVTIDKATDIIGEARAFDGPNPQPTQTPNDLVNFRSDEVLDGPFPFLRVILATGSVATSYGGSGEASIRTDFKIAKLSLKVGGQTVNTDQLFYLESTSPGIGDSNPAQSAGTNGDDVLSSRKGKDDGLFGLFGDDLFIADAGADIFWGDSGSDTVDYGASRKPISVDLDPGRKGVFGTGSDGAAGDLFNSVENVLGGRKDDTITGDNAGNLLRGGKGDDTLLGGGGRDRLFGERGDDRLDGGRGRDLLVGGGGEDTFVFGTGSGKDTLRGFRPDVDTLDLSGAGFANRKQALDAFEQAGRDLHLDLGGGDLLVLRKLSLGDLSTDDILV